MKKQFFIIPFIACMLAMFNAKAQNTPIDDFLRSYPSMEGVTSVTISQQMLQSIFPQNRTTAQQASSTTSIGTSSVTFYSRLNVPEAYSSVSVSSTDIPANWFADFKKTLLSSRYEPFMEMNRENNNILGYYMKKVNDNTNEIVVLRQQKDQFSAIYIKGDIDIDQLDGYLSRIRSALNRMSANPNQTDMFEFSNPISFRFNNPIYIGIPARQTEESVIKQMKEYVEKLNFLFLER